MDSYLRELERRAISGTEEDLHNYLQTVHRVGRYRSPKRKEIQDILRRQMKQYRGMRFSPRYFPEIARINKSSLQHPREASLWTGESGSWKEALHDAMPGDVFEVDVYASQVYIRGNEYWSLVNTHSLSVPEIIFPFNEHYYGPPPDFRAFRRNPDDLEINAIQAVQALGFIQHPSKPGYWVEPYWSVLLRHRTLLRWARESSDIRQRILDEIGALIGRKNWA